jgi:bifunctional non-homologous end joining protein LigD
MINYYMASANYILPYLKNRPHSLNRHPNGINGPSFYQKNICDELPEWIGCAEIYSESNDKIVKYFVITNRASLIYMANLGCIEINPWFSEVKDLENPDYIAIDLDPVEIGFDKVIDTALAVKEVLDKAKIKGYCKTSGATGLHIYIPLNKKYVYDVGRQFALVVAQLTHELVPAFTSLERNPSKRKRKVYIDYLQNRTGQTLAAPYSLRPKPGAPVSTPLEWKEVKRGLSAEDFNINSIHKRVERKGDLFEGVLGKGINIIKALNNLGLD